MIIEIPNENSVVRWKNNEKDEWKIAEISDLIKAYEERSQGKWLHKKFDTSLREYGQCSNCLQRERVGNFCRNCGADMRGEDTNETS